MTMSRRSFLSTSIASAAATRWWLDSPTLARAAGREDVLVPLTKRPPNYESVRSTFTTRITPLQRFYLRNHFPIPDVDPSRWRLEVKGLVERPLSLTLADLERIPSTTVEAVLQCAGNGRGLFEPRVPGVQWRVGAVGNATWTGARLRDVLALAHPQPQARHLHLQGAEEPPTPEMPRFIRGIPIEKALHPDTLLATKMNGQPVPAYHGGPVRLVLPGWVADDWMKWLSVVHLAADEPRGYWYDTAYRFPIEAGRPGAPVPADRTRPMTLLNVKSIIGSLADGAVLRPGTHEVVGVAFSGQAAVAVVDVSFDGGRSWHGAALDGPPTPYGFRVFRHAWHAARAGRYVIASRARDAAGAMQPETATWNPSGYLYNAIDRVQVEVRS